MSLHDQDVHLLNYLILTSFGDHSGAFRAENFAAPDLLTSHLRFADFFELRLKRKSPQKLIL
jgi:hypothetical protein